MNAGAKVLAIQKNPPQDAAKLNQALIAAERALLSPQGLPNRPWFRHVIYAPGQYTGYAAVVIPGVNEAIDAKDAQLTAAQLQVLTDALNRAAAVLEAATVIVSSLVRVHLRKKTTPSPVPQVQRSAACR